MCFPKASDTSGIILLLIGLDSSGKSSFLMRLRNGSDNPPKSGWGFSVDMVQYNLDKSSWFKSKRKMIKIYDLGGDQKIRGIWKNYLAEVCLITNYLGTRMHLCR
jgi:ADP-ribosylation factor-like protein 13B